MLTCEDKELLKQKGITEEQIAEQLACFEKGFGCGQPYVQEYVRISGCGL